jgi:hypothetical protein
VIDESRCKVVISAEAQPEDLFFPDALEMNDDATNETIMSQEAISDALIAPFRPNISSYNSKTSHRLDTGEGQRQVKAETSESGDGDASRMFGKKKLKAPHPSEETSAAFKTLSIFTGEDERFAYVSLSGRPACVCRNQIPVLTSLLGTETSCISADRNDSQQTLCTRRVVTVTRVASSMGEDRSVKAPSSARLYGGC